MPRENSIVDQMRARFRKMGARTIKTHGSNLMSGEPDIVGCFRGYFFAVEVKQPGRYPTPQQYAVLRAWQRAGAIAFWSDDPAGAQQQLLALVAARREESNGH